MREPFQEWQNRFHLNTVALVQESVEQQRLEEYQNRVANWISEQGILFQLRHAGVMGGTNFLRKLAAFLFSLVIVFLIVAAISYGLLLRHYKSGSYAKNLSEQVQGGLAAEEVEFSGFSQSRTNATFRYLTLEGGDKSFFSSGKLTYFSAPMGFLEGVRGTWGPDSVRIKRADFEIKAGGEGEMDHAFDGILETLDGSSLGHVEIDEASFDWGYSKLTYGRVAGSELDARLSEGKWYVTLKGGTFQQNWLQGCEIEKAELVISSTGIQVEAMDLKLGSGALSLAGEVAGTRSFPEFDLKGSYQGVAVEDMLNLPGIRVTDFLSGTISGDLKISGSTNKQIEMKGSAELQGNDVLVLRDQWEIIRNLSLLDKNRTYRRIDFSEGRFTFETGGGGLKLNDLVLSATDEKSEEIYFSLVGALTTRLPSQVEAADMIGMVLTDGFSSRFGDDVTDLTAAKVLEDERMSLKKAAGGGKQSEFGQLLFDDSEEAEKKRIKLAPKEIESQRLKSAMNVHKIEGELTLRVQEQTFDQYPILEGYYLKADDGMRELPLNLSGSFSDLTKKEAELMLMRSRQKQKKSAPETKIE